MKKVAVTMLAAFLIMQYGCMKIISGGRFVPVKQAVVRGHSIYLGMTTSQVRAMLGQPDKIQTGFSPSALSNPTYNTAIVWHYDNYGLVFENGILTSMVEIKDAPQ